jgi:hypothetical protein
MIETNSTSLNGNLLNASRNTGVIRSMYSFLIFTVVFILFSWAYNYAEVLFLRPQGVHQWRQTDCLSFTDNFYQDSRKLTQPAMHYQGYDGTGQTISEFPIIYWVVGNLWKITGKQEYIFRLLELLIFFIGLFSLFKFSENILSNTFWAFTIVFGLFTSTILAYYANNFMADVPALSFVFIAWYFILRYYNSQSSKYLLLGSFFFLLAGLLKISSALSFMALIAVFFLRKGPIDFFVWDKENRWDVEARKIYLFISGVFIIWIAWYSYARWYNHTYNYGIFLIGILPIWELDSIGIRKVLFGLFKLWRQHFFRDEMHVLIILALSWLVYKRKDLPSLGRGMLLWVGVGFVSFLILFFQVFDNHDYYTLNLLVFFPIIWLVFLKSIGAIYPSQYKSWILKVLVVLFILHCADFTRRRMLSRYERLGNTHTGVYEKVTPWLRSIGIQREDKVISVPDNSPNSSLYLMDQKGWSDYAWLTTEEEVYDKVKLGAKYLISYDSLSLNKSCYQSFKDSLLGVYVDPRYPQQVLHVWKLKSTIK